MTKLTKSELELMHEITDRLFCLQVLFDQTIANHPMAKELFLLPLETELANAYQRAGRIMLNG